MIRFLRAYFDLLAASLEARAAELREYAADYAESEYWRGYAEGVRDGRQAERVGRRE